MNTQEGSVTLALMSWAARAVAFTLSAAVASGCCVSASGETSVPSVDGVLRRDGRPLANIPVRCSGRKGETSTRTAADGTFHCDSRSTRVIVFGDTGCHVTVRFQLPEGKTLAYSAGAAARPCAKGAHEEVRCDITGTLSEDVWTDDSAGASKTARASCVKK